MLVNDGGIATQPKAPGHGCPLAITAGAPCRDRLRAAPRAPGADVPPAITAGAPGQHRLRAALLAPGHDRPLAASSGAAERGRPRAATRAPGADVPPAIAAEAPGQHRLSAVAYATVVLPAGPHRPRQEDLPHTPANPRTPTHLQTQDTVSSLRLAPQSSPHYFNHHSRGSGNPRPPVLTGGPQGGYAPATRPIPLSFLHSGSSASSLRPNPPTTPRPTTGRRTDSPSLAGKGPGDRSKPHHTWHYQCGCGLSEVRSTSHQVQPAIQVPPHPRPCSTAKTGLHRHHPSRAPPPTASSLRRKPQSTRLAANPVGASLVAAPASPLYRSAMERGRG